MAAKWDIAALAKAPKVYDAPGFGAPGLRALFYEGPKWRGRSTRVFAWYGAPKRRGSERFPAMVLIHGGGGTGIAEWVTHWVKRGYAAISMDTCGGVPAGNGFAQERVPHEFSGPAGCRTSFEPSDEITDHWPYQAVSLVMLAHSLVASFPEVDPSRIGMTGVSWGGYLASMVAGVDRRFRFAIPVYGCGCLAKDSVWEPEFREMGPEKAGTWLGLWDPMHYLPNARMPMLWVTGTNDFAYPFSCLQGSYRLPRGERTLSIRIRLPHGHPEGWAPPEIGAFADSHLKGGAPLAKITGQGREGRRAWARFESETPVTSAELTFTRDSGKWQDRYWESVPATVGGGRTEADVPDGAVVYYINLFDERGLAVSGEHEVTG